MTAEGAVARPWGSLLVAVGDVTYSLTPRHVAVLYSAHYGVKAPQAVVKVFETFIQETIWMGLIEPTTVTEEPTVFKLTSAGNRVAEKVFTR